MKWEYKTFDMHGLDRQGMDSTLEVLGGEGWELVQICGNQYYFKRPVRKLQK